MTQDKHPMFNRLGVNPDRIALWGKRTPLDLWSMPAAELRAVLDTLLAGKQSPGEVDD